MATLEAMTERQFYAVRARNLSPEWDYGVNWTSDGHDRWPLWRVSWVVETGEVIAVCPAHRRLLILGVVPKVGDYPYSAHFNSWSEFNRAQTIERVMDGWAEGDFHKPLSWVLDRLAEHGFAV